MLLTAKNRFGHKYLNALNLQKQHENSIVYLHNILSHSHSQSAAAVLLGSRTSLLIVLEYLGILRKIPLSLEVDKHMIEKQSSFSQGVGLSCT